VRRRQSGVICMCQSSQAGANCWMAIVPSHLTALATKMQPPREVLDPTHLRVAQVESEQPYVGLQRLRNGNRPLIPHRAPRQRQLVYSRVSPQHLGDGGAALGADGVARQVEELGGGGLDDEVGLVV
jgi:hypothetical protein